MMTIGDDQGKVMAKMTMMTMMIIMRRRSR